MKNKKKLFLIIYGAVVFSVTAGFLIWGEHPRDPRFYLAFLVIFLTGRVIGSLIDKRN